MTTEETLPAMKPSQILNFWFGTPGDDVYGTMRPIWFDSNPDFDKEVRVNFFEDYEKAIGGEYDDWKEDPLSCLALILLFDQFPRNMFRGTAAVYSSDMKAVSVSMYAIEKEHDLKLNLPILKKFMYMPLLHSEDLNAQKQYMAKSETLNEYYGPDIYSKKYYETILLFGRFPHRNELLGRTSTPEEIEYLKKVEFPNP